MISLGLVAPFIVLQRVNRGAYQEELPFVLFAFMSVHALLIVLLATPALRRLGSRRRLASLTPGHWAGLLVSALLVAAYAGVVTDQLPCFLGVPNCD